MAIAADSLVYAASRKDLEREGRLTVNVGGHAIVLVLSDGVVYAVNNRCPHMGFPLDRGSIDDGILTCHWHHARFDLCSGGTFDQWADDVQTYPVHVEVDAILVDVAPRTDAVAYHRRRLRDGLQHNIRLVIGKSVIGLFEAAVPSEPFQIGLEYGTSYRGAGWGQGLTMHACFMNMLPDLAEPWHARALYHGLDAVARDTVGMAPRFPIDPLPQAGVELLTLKRWFRRFIEVRDAEGAERCLVSAIQLGDRAGVADMLLAAATDHRYIQIGHVLDFINKALEALDHVNWQGAEHVLTSLVPGLANATRMEESNAWRNPINLVGLLDETFAAIPDALAAGAQADAGWADDEALARQILSDDPQANCSAMLRALGTGATPEQLAAAVTHAAGLRIAHFHTSNEFGDWDTVLHTFTFANAVHQATRRVPSMELTRGIFDAAMSVYLDRFLNTPAARLPSITAHPGDAPDALCRMLLDQLNTQQQVSEVAAIIGRYTGAGASAEGLLATLGEALLREDRDFHTVQAVEASFRQYHLRAGGASAEVMLIACARYLAAHAPTARSQGQTYRIAERLHRGDRLFEAD